MTYAELFPPHLRDEDLLSPREVAGYLSVTVRTVLNWAANGRLPQPLVLGPKTRRFRVGDVRAALGAIHLEDLKKLFD